MKPLLFTLLLCLISPQLSLADEVDDALAKMDEQIALLESMKAELEKNYYETIKVHLQYTASRYYSFITYDYFGVVAGTLWHAERDNLRLLSLNDEIQHIQSEIQSNPGKVELYRANLFFAQLELENLIRNVETYEKDLNVVREGWKSRCRGKRFEEEKVYFDPKRHFNPDRRLTALVSPAGGFSIGVSVTMSTDGSVNGASAYTQGTAGQEEWEPMADTVALALSCYCGPYMPACFAGYYIVKLAILYDGREDDLSNKERKQYDLIAQIREIQLDAIDQLGASQPDLIQNICKDSIEIEPQWSYEKIQNLKQNLKIKKTDLDIYISDELAIVEEELVKFIKEEYVPEVKSIYVTNLEEYYNDKKKKNADARKFLLPIVAKISQNSLPRQAVSKILYQHSVWEKVIEGDSQFLPLDQNSSLKTPNLDSFENRWSTYGRTLLQKVIQ